MVSAQWFAHNKYLMHKPLNHPVSWLYTTITTRRDRNFTSELTQSYYVGHPRQLSTTKTQHNNNTENNNNIFDQHFTNAYLRHPRLLTINQHVSKGPYWQKGTGSALELKGWHRRHVCVFVGVIPSQWLWFLVNSTHLVCDKVYLLEFALFSPKFNSSIFQPKIKNNIERNITGIYGIIDFWCW